jgi:phage tail P2-like protein
VIITQVGSIVASCQRNGNDVTLTFSTPPQPDDVIYLVGGAYYRAGATYGATGYTELFLDTTFASRAFGVWRLVVGASPPTTVVGLGSGNTSDTAGYAAVVLRGVDISHPEDVALTSAINTTGAPDASLITPATDNCAIVFGCGSSLTEVAPGTVAGYTVGSAADFQDANPYTVGLGFRILSGGAGVIEDPPAWSAWIASTWRAVTIAVRPSPIIIYDLTAGALSVTAPVVSASVLRKLIPATDLTVGILTIPSATFVQKHSLAATSYVDDVPAIGAGIANSIVARPLEVSVPVLGSGDFAIAFHLIISAPVISSATFAQGHALVATSYVNAAPIINVGFAGNLVASDLAADVPVLDSGDFNSPFWPADLAVGAPFIDSVRLEQNVNPYPNDPNPYPYTPIEHPGAKLLYRESTPLEKALADTDAERLLRIHAEVIIAQWDPYAISYHNLPFLAWAMGVNLWEDGWREITKRTWVARQWTFKSLRGTADGLKMAVDYAGRDISPFGYQVTKLTRPPQQVFSGPDMTREEREEWLEFMPQLRVWRTFERGWAEFGKSFYGGRGTGRQRNHRFFLGGEPDDRKLRAITPSTAIERLRRRARWIVRGEESDTHVSEFGTYWRVHLRGIENSSVFTNRSIHTTAPKRFYIPTTAAKRLITIMPRERLPWRTPAWASMEPMGTEAERIVINSTRRRSVFSDQPMRLYQHDYYVPTDAWSRIYGRYAINDGSVELNNRRPVQFMGVGFYGFPKYTAWVGMSLKSQRRLAVFSGIPFNKYYQPHDPTPVKRAKRAVQASKKIADRILLELGPVPRFVAGRPFFAGLDRFIVSQDF